MIRFNRRIEYAEEWGLKIQKGSHTLVLPAFFLLVLAASLLAQIQGTYYATRLVPSHDGVQYLALGSLVLRGEAAVFDDRVTGNRLPIPFYILGATQWWGPDLMSARLLNVWFGAMTVWLTAWLARALAGPVAGVLAAWFLATQGVIIAYFSYEAYPAIAACAMAACLLAMAKERWLLGAALITVLLFTRSNLWPAVPMLAGWALWHEKNWWRRNAIFGLIGWPIVVYLWWDPSHLKLLAYVPLVRNLVEPLGYVSVLTLDNREVLPLGQQLYEAARLVRRYEFWALALAVLVLYRGWRGLHKPLTVLLGVSLGVMVCAYSWNVRWLGLYFVPYAPVFAAILGIGFAPLLKWGQAREWTWLGSQWRGPATAALLAVLMVPPVLIARNPLLPPWGQRGDALAPILAEAKALKALVPPGANVYYYGMITTPYLGGFPITHLEHLYTPTHLPRIAADERTIQKSGLEPPSLMRVRLTYVAQYAILDDLMMEQGRPDFGPAEREMEALVKEHFDRIGTAGRLGVYQRKLLRCRTGCV